MEAEYSKRELDSHFGDVKESLDRIEAQVVKTNGRVSKLEIWRGYIAGALAIISFVVIPLVVYSFNVAVDTKANKAQER